MKNDTVSFIYDSKWAQEIIDRRHQEYLDLPEDRKKELQEEWARHIERTK